MGVTERNKEVKGRLGAEFGRQNVRVIGGHGTAWGWCHIEIKVKDPCPDKQKESPCGSYCLDGICKGNNQAIRGGWGNTARQMMDAEIRHKVWQLIKDVEFYTYADDMGGDHKEVIIEVKFDHGQV